jgi:DHA3 family tetracycline resistance protein-like MFS transporter
VTRRRSARTVYLAYEAGFGGFTRVMWTTYIVFATVELGLDPLQLVLLGTVLEVSYLLFEVPTGVVADVMGRRLSVVIGVLGSGVGFLVLALAPGFGVAVVSQALWGVFATFTSGADVAWITDEVGEQEAHRLFLVGGQAWHIAALVGIVAGVGLAIVDLRLPVFAGAIGIILLGLWMAVRMPEEHWVRPERVEGARRSEPLRRTLREGIREVRTHPVLGMILIVALLYGMASEGWDRLGDLHVLTGVGLDPTGGVQTLVWLGVLEAVALILGFGLITVVKRRTHLEGHAHVARILAVLDIGMFAAVVVFAGSRVLWLALAMSWTVQSIRSARELIFTAWVNQGLEPSTRATVNSMATLSHSVGEAAAGPVIGTIANRSVPLGLVVSALVRLPALYLYRRAIARGTVGTATPADEVIDLSEEE